MARRFQERVNGSSAKRRFELEPLEQRCLLSGGVAAVAASPLISHTLLVGAETQTDSTRPAQKTNACDGAAEVGSILPPGNPTPTAQTASAQTTSTSSTDAVAQGKEGTSQSVTANSAGTQTAPGSQSANITISSGQSQVDGSPAIEQLTQTLTAANGPPSAQTTLGPGNSAAILNLASFSQGPNATATIRLGGVAGPGISLDGFDQLNVAGLAHLDGTLQIQLSNGFVPQPGQKFKVLTWGSRTGQFANWLGTTGIPGHPDYYFLPIYNAHDLTLEVIEDPNISPGASTAIQNGLNTLSQIGTLLNNVGSYAQSIPLIGDKLSSFIDSGSAISHVITQQIQNLLTLGPTAEAAVTSAIQGWDGTTVAGFQIKVDGVLGHYDATGTGPFWWDLTLEITPAAISKTLQNVLGGALGAVFSSAPSVQVNGKLTVNMSFGYDSVFFVKLASLTAEADVSATGLSGFPFQLSPPGGPVSMNVTNGSVTLSASITATPDASILTANLTTGPRIEMSTLTSMAASGTATSNAFNFAKTSNLNSSFTLNGNITFGGISLTGTTMVQIQSSDLFGGAAPAVTVVVDSSLSVMGQTLTGTFTFKQTATETDLEATGVTLNMMAGAQRVLQATGSGEFALVGSGLAGMLSLTLTQGPNIPGLTLTGTSLNLALNTASTTVATVDGNAVNLPAGPYYRVSGHATLGLSTPSANLTADFDFEPNGSNEVDVGIANLAFNFDNGTSNLLSVTNGSGAFVVTSTGIYGTTTASVSMAVPGVALAGTSSILLNNTGSAAGPRTINVNGATVNIPSLPAGPYLQVQATGAQLTVMGIALTGDFLFENKTTNASHKVVTVAAANVSFNLGTITNNLLNITNGSGAFIITANGVAGTGNVSVGINLSGLTLSGTFGIQLNQTSSAVNETVNIGGSPVVINLPAGPYLQVNGTGVTLGFMGVGLTGNFSFEQRTSTDHTQEITVSASNVSFNFGTSVITATNGSGFFLINDAGIAGQGTITVSVAALSLSHTFTWDFNNTDPAINQIVTVDGIQKTLTEPDGPFNKFSSGGPVSFSVTAGGQTESISAALVVTLMHPDNNSADDYVTVGVSSLSTTLAAGPLSLAVSGGTGAFVIRPSSPSQIAGMVTVSSATLTGASAVTLTATNLQLQFNNTGGDVPSVSVAIDDNPADNVTIQFTGAYYHNYLSISGSATLGLAGFIDLGGNFAIEVSDANGSQFKLAGTMMHFDLKAGSTTVVSFNQGTGELVIGAGGLAGTATLQFQAGIIGMTGTIGLEVNTTNAAINTTVNTPNVPAAINLTNTNYLKVNVNGSIRVGSLSLPFNFYIFYDTISGQVQFWETSPNTELVSVDSSGNIALHGPFASLTNLDFAQPGSFDFVSMLRQLGTWFDSFRSSSLFSVAIPFANGKTIGDAFDWSQLFIDDLYSHLVSVELQSSTIRTGQPTFTTGPLSFQLQFNTDTAVTVNLPAPPVLGDTTFTDADVKSWANFINTNLPGAVSSRIAARENIAGQLVIALADSEVAKGTQLSIGNANSAMDTFGFGPAASGPYTAQHVAVLTSRFSTDGSNGTTSLFYALSDLLNDGSINGNGSVNYNAAQQVYTFDVNSSTFLPANYSFKVPFSFNQDLGPIGSVSLNGQLNISASVGFHFTIGFDMGATDVPRVLSSSQIPAPANGQISSDAHFKIYLNDDPANISAVPINLTLTQLSTAGDNNLNDLANQLNTLFHTVTLNPAQYPWLNAPTTLDNLIIAQKADTGLAISAKSAELGIINRIAITSATNDTWASELGFGMQLSQDQHSMIAASNSNIKGLFIDNASLSGSLSVTPDLTYNPNGISGSVKFGFVNITVPSGTFGTLDYNGNPNPLTVSLSLQDKTTNATRFYISDLMHGTSSNNILNMVSGPNFTGSFLARLSNISVGGLGFSFPLGSNPQVSVWIPDFKNLTFNDNAYDPANNNEGIFLTYPNLAGLLNFTDLNFTSIIQAFQAIASNLSQLSAFSFLNQKLPLIDMSVNDLIGYASKFADLVNAAASGGSQSLQDTITNLNSQIDDVFHLNPNILTISLDGLSPASLVTSGGDATHPATTTINPEGDNNAITITASSNGTTLNGSVIRIVGSSDITDSSAQASWDASNKILTIKINAGQTTTNAIITAIAAIPGTPWTATLPATDNSKPDTGNGTVTTFALKFNLNLSTLYSNTVPFHLNLQQLLSQVAGNNSGLAAFLNGVTSIVQAGGSGTLSVTASAALTLDFGLDLTNPSSIRPFLYDDTGVVLRARITGTNLSFSLTLGAVAGIQIQNGSVTLDGDGNPNTTPTSTPADQGAEFDLTLKDSDGTGRHYFDSNLFSTNNINLRLVAGVSADLPVYATIGGVLLPLGNTAVDPTTGHPGNDLYFSIPDLSRFFGDVSANGNTAILRFVGPNNDISITSPTNVTDYTVVLQQAGSAGANYDSNSNTLTIQLNSGTTTAQQIQTAIQGISGWTVSFLANDPSGSNTGAGTVTTDKLQLFAPDLSSLFNNLDFCSILSSATGPLLDGLDTLLGKLQDGIDSFTSAVKLPLIGDGLSGAANFISSFRNGLLKELRDDVQAAGGSGLTAVQDAIKKAFWNSLGPGGLNLLVDPTTGNAFDPSKGFSQLDVKLDCNTGLTVNLRMKKDIALVDTSGNPIKFDIGVPGFGLQGNINVKVALGFDLYFGFGVSPQDGFYFKTSSTHPELQLYFRVSLPDTHFSGQLLFLQLDVADDHTSPSMFQGQFAVNITDPDNSGKLTWAELTSGGLSFSDIVHPVLSADANVTLDLAASFGGDTAFPRVLAQFHLRWHFDTANGAGEPQISFDNIELDVGSFISSFLAPILSKIQDVTKPLQPIIDVVTARIPILSDLAGHTITLLDLAQLFGLLEPSTVDFIKDVAQVITLINDISGIGQGDILIPFGSFSLTSDSSGNMTNITPQSPNAINLANSIANDPGPSSTYLNATEGFAKDLGSLKNFSIPIFDHPSQLFNLFIGKPVALIEWRMPQFKFTFTYVQKIPIYPPLYAQFGGSIGATINIGFGYDTYGIQEFINDPKKRGLDLLDGFYIITNDTNGQPQPALTLTGEIFAGASIDLVIVEVGVRGGVTATVNFFWNDNSDNDGKMRVNEIIANALEDPRCIFNIQGSISLFLEAYLKINLFFFSIDKTWRFATITLVTFDLSCPEPVLGEMNGSVLTLNIGTLANLRQYDDTTDDSETFVVRHTGGSAGSESVQVTWAQHTQSFTGVSEILAQNTGQGDNVVDLRGVQASCDLTGGSGNNTFYLSDGAGSVVHCGSGTDTVVASSASTAMGVVIYGGDGNDTITGGTKAITIYGGAGNNTITGTPEADVIYGGGGTDVIHDPGGNNFIAGGPGNTTIYTGDGSNFVTLCSSLFFMGDISGAQSLVSALVTHANPITTYIWGQFTGATQTALMSSTAPLPKLESTLVAALDTLVQSGSLYAPLTGAGLVPAADTTALENRGSGPQGQNQIRLNRMLLADAFPANIRRRDGGGTNTVYGGSGGNVIYGGDGQDVIYGGAGNDILIAGTGNDQVFGSSGNDLIIGAEVNTITAGDANLAGHTPIPVTFANTAALLAAVNNMTVSGGGNPPGISVEGLSDGGDDLLVGGGGSDVIFGGKGNDFIYGGNFVPTGTTAVVTPDGNNFIAGGPGNDTIFGTDAMGRPGTVNTGIAIKSSVWYDQNLNGLRDSAEKGLGGVTVWLYRAGTPPDLTKNPGVGALATTTTDVDGNFQFVGLDANNYILVFSLPATLAFTTPNTGPVGSTPNVSNAVPTAMNGITAGMTAVFNVGFNTTFTGVSAGYTGNATVSITDTSVPKPSTGQTPMVFNVTLSGPQAAPVQVEYQTLDGTATASGGDYVASGDQVLTFNPGETSKQITVMILGNTTFEPNKQFQIQVVRAQRMDPGSPVNLLLSQPTIHGTIINTSPIPSISITDYNPVTTSPLFAPGDFANQAVFLQKLSTGGIPTLVSSFVWSKFTSADQQLLTSASTTSNQQALTLVSELNTLLQGPSIYTAARFASVTLSSATSLLLATSPTGPALILLNRLLLQDAYPTELAKTVAGAGEGDPATFTLSLSNPSQSTITVDWRTDTSLTPQGLPAADAAIPAPLPYANFVMASGTVTFQPGQTRQTITVTTLKNNYNTGDVTFFVDLSNSTYATIADIRAYGLIHDTDPLVSVSITPVVPVVGLPFQTDVTKDPTSPVWVYFNVTLSQASGQTVTVTWGTSPGTAVEVVSQGAPNYPDMPDYVGFPNSTTPDSQKSLVFNPGGPLTQMIGVQVNPTKPYAHPTDTRTFFVNLISASNANVAANPPAESNHVTVVIQQAAVVPSDPGPWAVFFSSPTYDVQEPTSGTTTVPITIERAPGSSQAVAVFYTTNGTAIGGAGPPADYLPVFRQIIRFGPNELFKTIPITIYHDGLVDGDETVILSLRNPTGGPVRGHPSTSILTIHEGANTPLVEVFPPTDVVVNGPPLQEGMYEGNVGITPHNFAIALLDPVTQLLVNAGPGGVTVQYTTVDLTGRAGVDYVATSGVATIPSGSSFVFIPVGIIGNTIPQLNRTFALRLSNANGATLLPNNSVAIATIFDDDLTPITGRIFYDTNNNRFQDLNEIGMPNVKVDVTYFNAGTPITTTVTTDANGNYTTNVLLGQVTIQVHADSVTSPYGMSGPGTSWLCTTNNQSQTIQYSGIVGLPGLDPIGYILNAKAAVAPNSSHDTGNSATDNTIFGGPGNDTIFAGNGFNHVVGGSWMTATDSNVPVNKNYYDAVVNATTNGLSTVYGSGPIWSVDTSGLNLGGSISGQIFFDANNNGKKDPGEIFTGQYVLVTLLDCNGDPVNAMATNTGNYSFTGLYIDPHGGISDYVVQFDVPNGYDFIAPMAGGSTVLVGGRTGILNVSQATPTLVNQDAGLKLSSFVPVAGPNSFIFDNPSYSVSEAVQSGFLTVKVIRGSSYDARGIVLQTQNGTALAGVNYGAVSTLLQFGVGETTKMVNIPIYDTHTIMDCTTPLVFNVTLNDVTGRPLAKTKVYIGGQSYGSLTDNDTITGGNGWNIILGDSGNIPATAVVGASDPTGLVYAGGPGNDIITPGDGNEFVNGQLGNDTMYAGASLSKYESQVGNDTFYAGTGDASIVAGYGFNTIISTSNAPAVTLTSTTLQNRQSVGGTIMNTITFSGISMAEMFGGPKDTTFDLSGWGGSAFVVGGSGKNSLLVQNDSNMILKNSTLLEGLLYELLYGFYEDSSLSLASGATYALSGLTNVTLSGTGAVSNNTIDASGYSRPVTFVGSPGNHTYIGGTINNTFAFDADAPLGTDTITGNGPLNLLDFSSTLTTGVTVNLATTGSVQVVNANLSLKLTNLLQNLTGGGGNDTLTGNSLNNVIIGGTGIDTLIAGTGNTTFPFDTDTQLNRKTIVTTGAPGFNTLDFSSTMTLPINIDLAVQGTAQVVNANLTITLQGIGLQQVIGGAQNDIIRGNSRNDTLRGGPGDDLLQGRSGNDILDGGPGHNTLIGGGGVDTVVASGNVNFTLTNTLLSMSDGTTDTLDGITVADLTGGPDANVFNITGWTGTGVINGGDLPGQPRDNTIIAGATANFTLTDTTLDISTNFAPISISGITIAILTTGPGGHTMDASGFSGTVTLNGGDGNDTLIGGSGLNILNGGLGNDILIGGPGDNIVDGGAGNNTYEKTLDAQLFTLKNNSLVTEVAAGGPFQYDTLANIQNIVLTGGPSSNTFDVSGWTAGNATLNGGGGFDIVQVQAPASGNVTITNSSINFTGSTSVFTLNAIGGAIINAGTGNSILDASGFSGAVELIGGSGNDTFIAGSGTNFLIGGTGTNDFIFRPFGVLHSVYVTGGTGTNTLDFSAFNVPVAINLSTLGVVQAVAAGQLGVELLGGTPTIQNVIGGAAGGTLTGNSLNDTFTITGGVNNITGGTGTNTVIATADANMTLTNTSLVIGPNNNSLSNIQIAQLTGGPNLVHTIDASAFTGTTILQAGPKGDTLVGGSGINTFMDGPGNDYLRGGTGNNTYVFNVDVPQGNDTVDQVSVAGSNTLDFSAAQNNGVTINLSLTTAQTVAPNLTLTLLHNSTIRNVIGTPQVDYITGDSLPNTFTGNGGADVIVGGSSGNNIISETRDADFVLVSTSLTTASLTIVGSNPLFAAADIRDVTAFVARLVNDPNLQTRPVSQYVWSLIPLSTQTYLTNNANPVNLRQAALVTALNNILQGASIFDATRFAGVTQSDPTSTLLRENPTGALLVRLNRFLFVDTYQSDLATSLTSIQTAVLRGGISDNILDASGFGGAAYLYGLGGNNTLLASKALSYLVGGGLNDTLVAGAGTDFLYGGAGDNTFFAGTGNSTMFGGGGNDTFIFDISAPQATPANPNPPAPIPLGTVTIVKPAGEGYANTILGLGLAGVSVDLQAATQYFYYDLATNTTVSSLVALVGANYKLLLTLNLSPTGTIQFAF